MQNIINFNLNEPWNYDFYQASIESGASDQDIADLICESIPGLQSIPFYIVHSSVYFILPSGTTIPEGMLNNIVQVTEVPTEAEILAAQVAAAQSENPPE